MRTDRGLRRARRAPALAIVALLIVPAAQPPRPQILQASTRIVPDTVRIGEPFVVVLRVQVPKTVTVVFPTGPDSGATVEALDPRAVAVTSDSTSSDYSATYRLVAWDLGRQAIAFAPATVHGGKADGPVPFGGLAVLVRPTTPTDAAHRVPRAARALFAMPRAWWPLWQILLVAVGTAVVIWLLSRWWRRRPRAGAPPADPFADATREFGTLERVGLLEAGEPGRYVALSIDITRTYLLRRVAPESMALTSAELNAAMAGDRRIPHPRLRALLAESDRVKFARQLLTADTARAMGADARRLVEEVEQRATAAEAAAAAASGARGSAA